MMKTLVTLLALFSLAGNVIAAETAAPAAPAAKPATAGKYPNQGKVLEVMDASIYTYLQVTTDKGPVWIAASKTKVAKGATVSYPNGAVMNNFHSQSLNRTFESIIFLDKIEVMKN